MVVGSRGWQQNQPYPTPTNLTPINSTPAIILPNLSAPPQTLCNNPSCNVLQYTIDNCTVLYFNILNLTIVSTNLPLYIF